MIKILSKNGLVKAEMQPINLSTGTFLPKFVYCSEDKEDRFALGSTKVLNSHSNWKSQKESRQNYRMIVIIFSTKEKLECSVLS